MVLDMKTLAERMHFYFFRINFFSIKINEKIVKNKNHLLN